MNKFLIPDNVFNLALYKVFISKVWPREWSLTRVCLSFPSPSPLFSSLPLEQLVFRRCCNLLRSLLTSLTSICRLCNWLLICFSKFRTLVLSSSMLCRRYQHQVTTTHIYLIRNFYVHMNASVVRNVDPNILEFGNRESHQYSNDIFPFKGFQP